MLMVSTSNVVGYFIRIRVRVLQGSDRYGALILGFPPVLARSGSDIDPMRAAIFINIVALLFFFQIVFLKSYL